MSSNQVTLVRQKRHRKRGRRPKNKVSKLVRDVAKIKKELITDIERKNLYINFGPLAIDNSGTMSVVANSVTQGDGVAERIGRSIKCSGIDFRYHVTANSAATAASMRVIVILDKTNALVQAADILYNGAGFTLGTSRACMSFYNRNNRNDFVVLYDKLHDFDFATGDFQVYEKINIKNHHTTKFVDDSALVAENAIRVFCISDQPLAGAARPTIEWVMSYYYTDM